MCKETEIYFDFRDETMFFNNEAGFLHLVVIVFIIAVSKLIYT